MCGRVVNRTSNGFDFNAAGMVDLCFFLMSNLGDRPETVDKPGLQEDLISMWTCPWEISDMTLAACPDMAIRSHPRRRLVLLLSPQ